MSILHRSAYLTLSAFLTLVPAACGGDDDDDDDDDTTDDGGNPDASVDEPDAGEPDAAAEPDAAVIEGDQFLLGINLTVLGNSGVIRNIATVAIDGATADISLQALISPVCNKANSGQPAGDPLVSTGIAIGKDGSFTIHFDEALIPDDTVGITLACNLGDVTASPLDVAGQLLPDGTFCGTITGTAAGQDLTGTFGTVAIEPNTPPEDLPEPVLECPAPGISL
jgi:hypothetical protein